MDISLTSTLNQSTGQYDNTIIFKSVRELINPNFLRLLEMEVTRTNAPINVSTLTVKQLNDGIAAGIFTEDELNEIKTLTINSR